MLPLVATLNPTLRWQKTAADPMARMQAFVYHIKSIHLPEENKTASLSQRQTPSLCFGARAGITNNPNERHWYQQPALTSLLKYQQPEQVPVVTGDLQ